MTEKAKFITNIFVNWTKGDDRQATELVTGLSDQTAGLQRLQDYNQRTDIEQTFRDERLEGFDMEHNRFQ